MPNLSPSPAPTTPGPAPTPQKNTWDKLRGRASTTANIVALFIFLVGIGIAGGYFYAQLSKKDTQTTTPNVETLSPDELKKLGEIGANLGTTGQILNIGANTLFRGKAEVTGDLIVGGRLAANGPVTLSSLNITGTTAATGLNVGSNLIVGGTTTLQKSLSVAELASVGSLNVSGSASMNTLNVTTIAVRNLSISGPLTIGHLTTQGPAPTIAGGAALGSGGTTSISGNDTAGVINLNIGSGTATGVLATITFRAAYGSTVHVLLTPLTSAGATIPAYITRNNTGFQIRTDTPPAAGTTLSFDYLVVQ